ncbi:MAG: DEAD/DEAH box helicase family protein [Candidatus Thiodiazotropha endolucinida]
MAAKKSTTRRRKTQANMLPFSQKLVLNQWLISLFGVDPLAEHKEGYRSVKPIQVFAKSLKDCREGLGKDNLHNFYTTLALHWQDHAILTKADLLRYEQNIASHTLAINEKRNEPIEWKYYQWLSLLFTEIYLDWYFNHCDRLLDDLNAYVKHFNIHWAAKEQVSNITPYTEDELNKLCLQNATGSGKTLLMHVNLLQFRHYAERSSVSHDLTRTILITPNENLSRQHRKGLKESGIDASRLVMDGDDMLSGIHNGLKQVDYTEVTKLGEEDGDKTLATRNLGDQNLLLVDEAHRGMGSQQERGWFKQRERLSEKGFVFEYSATFKEAVTAAKNTRIEESYAKSVVFDYSYRYFYEDGYGKDYRIYNLPQSFDQQRNLYLTACLLAHFQQLRLYQEHKTGFHGYNLEKPLWVFVGASVTKASGKKDEKEVVADVVQVLQFYAWFLANRDIAIQNIELLLTRDAQNTGLTDQQGNDIFAGAFLYLQEKVLDKKNTAQLIYQDILQRLFLNQAGGELSVARIKGDANEIMLRAGQAEEPFGLINVGDAPGLIKHIEEHPHEHIHIEESEFSETLFGVVHESSSPVNVLIGSKKFVEGWDCWRVSTLGLMHVGKSEGSQIIQLFGRGVRLKGYGMSLKRSGFATPARQPPFITYMETLNVFGIEADFMERFRQFLSDEDLPRNDNMSAHTIPLNITHDFDKKLKILRPKRKQSDGKEYDFKRDGPVPTLGLVPEILKQQPISVDWYPRIQSIQGRVSAAQQVQQNETWFKETHLAFLDYDQLYFQLEQFKRERSWYNLNIEVGKLKDLLLDNSWYRIIIPPVQMELNSFANVAIWQSIALELLKRYTEAYYQQARAAFIEPRLELRDLTREDDNIPDADEYQIFVDSSQEALVNKIKQFVGEIQTRQKDLIDLGELKAAWFEPHAYQPILHVNRGSLINISPVSLNESEYQFVKDLKVYFDTSKTQLEQNGIEIFLLRNESRGKGVGFFEAANFFPDFILWQLKSDMQYIAFIDPHGLRHEGNDSAKIRLAQEIKQIEKRVGNKKVRLNSFIVSPSNYASLNWSQSKEDLKTQHVFFMTEDAGSYINSIMALMRN